MRAVAGVLGAALLIVATPSLANDSTAELANNGLRFLHDPDIAIRSEDLAISTEAVKIAYVFENMSKSDKTVTIAFPMPDIAFNGDDDIGLPSTDLDNPFHFHVAADSAPITPTLDRHALVNGQDLSNRLTAAKIPFMPGAEATNNALDALPQASKDEFVKLGLAAIEEFTTKPDTPLEKHLTAAWTLRAAYLWKQTFPAGAKVRLTQDYAPSVGGSAQTMVGTKDWRQNDQMQAYPTKYCMEPSFEAAVVKVIKARKLDYAPFGEQRISYILKTGANWAGPIGDFHLTIDKGAPENFVSFCGEGVTKTGPTRFEMRKTDFTPTNDLDILILTPTKG